MPTYEYRCEVCQNIISEYRSFDDESPHPVCCGAVTTKILYAAPAHFKGTGWGKDGQ